MSARVVINVDAVDAEMQRRRARGDEPDEPDLSPLNDLPQGWFNHGPMVLALLERFQPAVVVELGSWLGASAIAMARMVQRWNGTVTCVDTWSADLDDEGGARSGPPLMILACARAMVDAGVSAGVRLIPATTIAAAARWREPIDALYVDADHSHAGCYADLDAWVPFVRPGGLVMGDDYDHPRYPGVTSAWDQYEKDAGLTLTRYQSEPAQRAGVRLIYGVKSRG